MRTPGMMKMTETKRYGCFVLVTGLVVAADQAAKALVLQKLPLYRTVSIIPGFFNLTHIQNPGGAFGFLAAQNSDLQTLLFLVITVCALGLILYFFHSTPAQNIWLSFGFALLFGGALGNLIDRLRFGRVIDFLDFYIGRWHWPAFNVADSAITVGVGLFILSMLLRREPL